MFFPLLVPRYFVVIFFYVTPEISVIRHDRKRLLARSGCKYRNILAISTPRSRYLFGKLATEGSYPCSKGQIQALMLNQIDFHFAAVAEDEMSGPYSTNGGEEECL
jgi:hypothetical protein